MGVRQQLAEREEDVLGAAERTKPLVDQRNRSIGEQRAPRLMGRLRAGSRGWNSPGSQPRAVGRLRHGFPQFAVDAGAAGRDPINLADRLVVNRSAVALPEVTQRYPATAETLLAEAF